nr:uncharacterized protein LOC110353098 [Anas platyrhynchos]XP_038023966.1 uncharacterized protein LOC110353098 [Anas platyrhynchos]XP_038023967.1 uncharacterized protein LOC110353098 [Anas platyrhynchos]
MLLAAWGAWGAPRVPWGAVCVRPQPSPGRSGWEKPCRGTEPLVINAKCSGPGAAGRKWEGKKRPFFQRERAFCSRSWSWCCGQAWNRGSGRSGRFLGQEAGLLRGEASVLQVGTGLGLSPQTQRPWVPQHPSSTSLPTAPSERGDFGNGERWERQHPRPPFCGRRVIYDMRGGAIVWNPSCIFSEGFASLPSPPLCRCYCTVAMGRAPRAAAMRGSAGEGRAPRPDPSGAPQPRCRQHPRAAPLTCRGPGNGAFGPSKFTATGGIQLPGGQRDPGRLAPFSLPLRLSAVAVSSAHTDPPVPFSS